MTLFRSISRIALLAAMTTLLFAKQITPAVAQKPSSNPIIVMTIEKRGSITIELLRSDAPKTVAHILQLVENGFYNGVRFHRLEKETEGPQKYGVLQGGDPATKKLDEEKMKGKTGQELAMLYGIGNGGSGKTVPLEASSSVHSRGSLGLARTQDIDSGDSQFFFDLIENHQWDYKYCVFGKVIKGLDVMDSVKQGDKITSVKALSKPGGKKKPTPKKVKSAV